MKDRNIGYDFIELFKELEEDPYNKSYYNTVVRHKKILMANYPDNMIKYNKYLYDNPDELNGFVPVLTNKEYDNILYSLSLHDQSKFIGTISKGVETTTHDFPSLRGTISKANYVYDKDASLYNDNLKSCEYYMRNIYDKCKNEGGGDVINIAISLKYDGMSVILTVKDNTIIKAVTRGDEDKTTDLTHIFKGMYFEGVDGGHKTEMIMTNDQFNEYCKRRNYNFSNPRIAVATLTRLKSAKRFADLVTFKKLGYETIIPTSRLKQLNDISMMELCYGNTIMNYEIFIPSCYKGALVIIDNYSKLINSIRDKLDFPIDGIVIELIDDRQRSIMGREDSVNKYEFALKFESNEMETKINKIDFTVGRTGKITPRVWYDTISFFGSTHNKTSISSINRFNNLKLGEGDIIKVSYNNDVLTYISEVVSRSDSDRYVFPDRCPICNSKLIVSDSGKEAMCINLDCPSKTILKLVHFLKRGFDIENFSNETIGAIYKAGLIDKNYPYKSLFEISLNDLMAIEGIGDITANSLINELNNIRSKDHVDIKILTALSIPNISLKTLSTILSKHTIYDLYDHVDLVYINGIGEKTVSKLYKWIDDNKHIIEYLRSLFNIINFKDMFIEKEGITYCTSGFRPDNALINKLEQKGYIYDKSLTKSKTDLLIVKDLSNSSGTVDKANKYNIEIILLDELLSKIDNDL